MPKHRKSRNQFYNVSRIIDAIYKGETENLKKYLMEKLSVVNHRDKNGLTPLHAAVIRNSFEALEILLQVPDVDPFKVSLDNRETSLFIALDRKANLRIVERLIKAGFDPNFTNHEGKTYLHVCKHTKFAKFAEIFIKSGANVDAIDIQGLTPLHEAVRAKNLKYVQLLLYHGADVTIKSFKFGNTAFREALKAKSVEIAYELLDYEVDFYNKVNFNGETTFAMAMTCSNDLAEAILERDFDNIDPDDYTLIHNITRRGNKNIFKRVWPVINKEILLDPDDEFLVEYLSMCNFIDEDWIDCLYEILDCEVACELVVDNSRNNIFALFQAFEMREINKSERAKIIYLFLSLGLPVELNDVLKFYDMFGHDEEFEAFLYMDVDVRISTIPRWGFNFLPGVLALDFGIDEIDDYLDNLVAREFSEHCFFELRSYIKGILRMINFCTIRKELRDEFFEKEIWLNFDNSCHFNDELHDLHEEVNDCFEDMDQVPSLLELCRNSVRRLIHENACKKKPCYYNTLLNNLKLPDSIKDIIKFKKRIYDRTDYEPPKNSY